MIKLDNILNIIVIILFIMNLIFFKKKNWKVI
jgi:hypothetical protein